MTIEQLIQDLTAKYALSVRYGDQAFCLAAIAEAQRHDGICAYIDLLRTLDPSEAEAAGVELDELYIAQPATVEEAFEIANSLLSSGELALIAVIGDITALLETRN
jgi:recombination protein RecA